MLKLNKADLKLLKELLDFGYLAKEKYEGALKEQRWTKSAKLALNKYQYEKKLFGDNHDDVEEQDKSVEYKNCEINFDNKQDCYFKIIFKNAVNIGKDIFNKLNAEINHKKLEQTLGVILLAVVFVVGGFLTMPTLPHLNVDSNNRNSSDVPFLQKQGELILEELVNLNKIAQKENKVEELVVSNAMDRVGFLIQSQLEYLNKIREIKSECAYFIGNKDFTKEEKLELFKACIKL